MVLLPFRGDYKSRKLVGWKKKEKKKRVVYNVYACNLKPFFMMTNRTMRTNSTHIGRKNGERNLIVNSLTRTSVSFLNKSEFQPHARARLSEHTAHTHLHANQINWILFISRSLGSVLLLGSRCGFDRLTCPFFSFVSSANVFFLSTRSVWHSSYFVATFSSRFIFRKHTHEIILFNFV